MKNLNALLDSVVVDTFQSVKFVGTTRPAEMFGHTTCLDHCGRIIVVGGAFDSGKFCTDLWIFNVETKEWVAHPMGDQGPSGRHFHSCVSYDRSLWVFGGSSNGIYHDLYKFNLDTNRWSAVATTGMVPSPRYGHTAVVYGDSMFVYGGFDQMGFACNDLYELHFTTLHWEKPVTTGAVPKEAYHHTAVVFQGSMYTFGGYRKTYNEIQEYRFATKAWSFVHTMGNPPIPRWGHTAVVCDQLMYVFGGRDRVANFSDLYSFSFETSIWKKIECEGIQGRFFCAAVCLDEWVYVFGGRNIHSFAFNDLARFGLKEARDGSLVEDFQALVGDPEFADIVFVVLDDRVEEGGPPVAAAPENSTGSKILIPPSMLGCKRIFAHKAIVCQRCPVLATMLGADMQEGRTGVITMGETTAAVVHAFLSYLYTDSVLVGNEKDLAGLLSAANQWQLPHLKHQVQLRLIRCLTLSNAIDMLQLAHTLDATVLFDACRAFLSKNLSLLSRNEWDSLPPSLANAVQFVASPKIGKYKH